MFKCPWMHFQTVLKVKGPLICAVAKSVLEPDKDISLLSREGNVPLPVFYEYMH